MDLNNIWNSFLEKIKNEIATISYDTWSAETKLINLNDNTATVLVPFHSQKKMLIEKGKTILIIALCVCCVHFMLRIID